MQQQIQTEIIVKKMLKRELSIVDFAKMTNKDRTTNIIIFIVSESPLAYKKNRTMTQSPQNYATTCWEQDQFHGGAVRIEANLPNTLSEQLFFYNKCITRKRLTLKVKVNVVKYSIHYDAIRLQISTSLNVMLYHFSLAFAVFEIFTF